MAFFGGELQECWEKRRCLNNIEGQVGCLLSVQGTVWRLKKEIKQTCSYYSYSVFACTPCTYTFIYIFTYIFFPYAGSQLVLLRAGVLMCMARECHGVGDRDHLCCFSFMSCGERKHLKLRFQGSF